METPVSMHGSRLSQEVDKDIAKWGAPWAKTAWQASVL